MATSKKKQNTALTALLAGVAAVGAFFFFRKKANAAPTPTPIGPSPVPDDDLPPVEPPSPTPVPKKNAPPMGMSEAKAISAGRGVVDTYLDQINAIVDSEIRDSLGPDWQGPLPEANADDVAPVRSLFDIEPGRTIASWVADAAYWGLFQDAGRIPASSEQGSGWQTYINVWNALYAHAKAGLLRGVNDN